jgi:hypothetical protein
MRDSSCGLPRNRARISRWDMGTLSVTIERGKACHRFDSTLLSKADPPVKDFFGGKMPSSKPGHPPGHRSERALTPSPIRMKPAVIRISAAPGKKDIHHWPDTWSSFAW